MRRTGRSTRRIDEAIQELFTTKECVVRDHYHTREADHYLLGNVLRRLSFEHNMTVNNGSLKVNNTDLTIKLV